MPRRSMLQTVLLIMLVLAGAFPLLYFASVEVGIAQAVAETESAAGDEPAAPFDRYVENVAFGIDEKFTYDINYGFINAGTGTMEVVRLIEFRNRPCFHIVSRAKSNKFFSTFYRVDDRVETIVDAIGLFSWRFEKNLREGKYRSDRMYEFDQRQQVVYYKDDTIAVPPCVQDALSVLYYVRTQKLEPGRSLFIENFTDGKQYTLEVKVHKRERITVAAGTFDCLLVEPLMRSVGVFKHEGQLKVWVTDDRLKMPVLMKSRVLVGSISAELVDYRLGEIETF
ncbi:MAG: DUF3108 domain-containing protein [Candidatus Zixiibacteriota bacterium]